jgi:MFS family permease
LAQRSASAPPAAAAKKQPASSTPDPEHRRAGHALDWFNLFVANIQTGFGPFIAVYLTSQSWTQTAIGLVLSIGTVAAMASQVPAGALVDAMPNKTRVAAFSVLAFTACALMFAIYPIPLFVYLAEILHGLSSCTLGPATAAMSLVLAGRLGMALRLGRNARYAAIGNGVGAALMGACGQYVSERAVFYLTAALTLPALAALWPLRKVAVARPHASTRSGSQSIDRASFLRVLSDRRILVFCACAMLFTFANAPLLMLISGTMTVKVGNPSLLIGACIVLPQIIVALLSPWVGRLADLRGRRLVLMLGFCALPLRCLVFAATSNPWIVVAVQALDGIGGACFGVMLPLIVSDVAARSRHFNLSLGFVGFAVGIGATLSTPAAGWLADHFGMRAAFFGLAAVGVAAPLLVLLAMPETRPQADEPD